MEESKVCDEVLKKVENKMEELITKEGVKRDNVDYLYKLVDIHKDIKNEEYWKVKEEKYMRYGNYGARRRDSMGRYAGEYGRRYMGNYSEGEDMLDEMKEHYGAYNESMGAYSRGNYNAGQDGMKALENTMEIFTEFTEKMIQEAETPEEKQIIKKYLKKVGQMG